MKTKRHFLSILLLLLGLGSAQAEPTVNENLFKPTIYVLATGGTIAGEGAVATASSYTSGVIAIEQMLAAVPDIFEVAHVHGEQICNLGSQEMTPQWWLVLAARVNELLARSDIDGVVITHGTDTQEETTYFLHLVVESPKPVVMTGSMRPATALGADGPRNLFNAVVCAASPASWGRGVMLVMGDQILSADDLSKTHTLQVNSFENPNFGPLGVLYNGQPIYTRASLRRHTTDSEFRLGGITAQLPRVEIIPVYAGATTLFVQAAADARARGVVVAGVGNGNLPAEMAAQLAALHKEGLAVVRSSRLCSGPTTQWDEVDDDALGFVTSWFVNPYRARVLLMLALTQTSDYREIQRIFREY